MLCFTECLQCKFRGAGMIIWYHGNAGMSQQAGRSHAVNAWHPQNSHADCVQQLSHLDVTGLWAKACNKMCPPRWQTDDSFIGVDALANLKVTLLKLLHTLPRLNTRNLTECFWIGKLTELTHCIMKQNMGWAWAWKHVQMLPGTSACNHRVTAAYPLQCFCWPVHATSRWTSRTQPLLTTL